MSFYGSVYYQLIDAFSNIAFNNSNNDSDIPTTSDISKDIEDIEAKGRTSALLLKGANKWIQIKSDPDNNTINFYHVKPSQGKNRLQFTNYNDNKDALIEDTNDNTVHQFQAGEYFSAYDISYDETGHICSVDKKSYQMPKSEVEEDLTKLQTLIGEKSVNSNIDEEESICTAIETNRSTIDQDILPYLDIIQQVYCNENGSDINNLFQERENGKYKNFPKYFGKIEPIIEQWIHYLVNNDIKNNLLENENYKQYITKKDDGGISFDSISAILSLIPGVFIEMQNKINSEINSLGTTIDLQKDTVTLISKAVDAEIFDAEHTIPEAFGNSRNNRYFSQDNSVAATIGLTKNNDLQFNKDNSIAAVLGIDPDSEDEQCYFNATNTVWKKIEECSNNNDNNSSNITHIIEHNNQIDTNINNINNIIGENELDEDETIMSVIKQLQDRIETLENQLNNSQSPEEETIE